jgi:hypothetical protein
VLLIEGIRNSYRICYHSDYAVRRDHNEDADDSPHHVALTVLSCIRIISTADHFKDTPGKDENRKDEEPFRYREHDHTHYACDDLVRSWIFLNFLEGLSKGCGSQKQHAY